MEINITSLKSVGMFAFSHSQAEGGPNAGPDTWNAALNGPRPLLNTPEEFDAFRDHVRGFGAWDGGEIDGWDENECQALFLQMIAGDVRESPATLEGVTFEERDGEWWHSSEDEPGMEAGPFASRSKAYRDACPQREPRAEALEDIDWPEYEAQSREGRISSHLWSNDGAEVYCDLSN